ncbi:MAG: YdcF family protein [Clostridiaceae bacterium]|nr:YdcF family protein [Clostridiaceae bacterium]
MKRKQGGRKFFAAFLIISGILLFTNTITAHNYSNDWNFGVILPAVMGLCCFAYSAFLLYAKGPIIRNNGLRTAILAVFIVCTIFFVVVEALIIIDPYIHGKQQAGRVDTVIVLGCGIWPDGRPTLALKMRLDKAIEYYEENPHVKIVVTGGQGPNEPYPEALAMEEYLLSHKVPKEKILIEDKSTSTRENFEYSRKVMNLTDDKIEKIVFVTNDFHVLRARILARRFGFDAYAIPAPTPTVIVFNSYLREFFAFVKSMVVDY